MRQTDRDGAADDVVFFVCRQVAMIRGRGYRSGDLGGHGSGGNGGSRQLDDPQAGQGHGRAPGLVAGKRVVVVMDHTRRTAIPNSNALRIAAHGPMSSDMLITDRGVSRPPARIHSTIELAPGVTAEEVAARRPRNSG